MHMFRKSSTAKQRHLVFTQYDAYQDGVLTEAETAVYHQHLDTCPECRAWVDQQTNIAQQLSYETSAPANLSPAAAARIQQKVFGKMRRALIMNNVRNLSGAAVAAAVLIVIVGIYLWQSRTLETIDTFDPITLDLDNAPDVSLAAGTATEQLFAAAEQGDIAQVEQLLEAGASPNAVDSAGDPVLKTAIGAVGTSGNTKIIILLLEAGADANAQDSAGDSLLPQAATVGQLEVVQLLLDAGADVDGLTSAGNGTDSTGLIEAAVNNHIEIAELLIAHGANVNHAESSMGVTVLIGAALSSNPEIITILLENGANPDIQCCPGFGGGPLHAAAEEGSVAAVRALLDGGADVDIVNEYGETPLMTAIRSGPSTSMVKTMDVLFEGGADPDGQDVNGNSALHHAAKLGKEDAIPILLENGAALDLQNNDGETAVDRATNDQTIELLQEAGAGD